jgi:hypothetical protein
MTAAIVGIGAMGAATSVIGGIAQNKEARMNASAVENEANYNAGVYRAQAGMVENQKQLKLQQDARNIRFVESKTIAVTAAKGIEMSGSPMAVLVDTMTQLEMDKAITAYNYDVEKVGLESQATAVQLRGQTLANQYRRGGRDAMIGGIVGGLTTLAGTAFYAGARMPGATATTSTGSKVYDYGISGKGYGSNPFNRFDTSGGALRGGAV